MQAGGENDDFWLCGKGSPGRTSGRRCLAERLADPEPDSKEEVRLERETGVIRTTKIMKSWEWVWEGAKRQQKGQRTSRTGALASKRGREGEGKQAERESA